MQISRIDVILSAWQKEGEILPYSRIKEYLVSRRVIKKTNDRSLSRWLKNLVRDGILKKNQDGYALEMKPKEYQVFDYLNELRQQYSKYIYEGEVGGFLSHISALTYLNFDEALVQKDDERFAFELLTVRLAELFSALYQLRNVIIKRRCGLDKLDLPEEAIREALFGMLLRGMEHTSTGEVVRKYSRLLKIEDRKTFRKLWEANKPRIREDIDNYLGEDFFFDKITEGIEENKKYLKKTAHLDIEKCAIEQLKEKYARIEDMIQDRHKKELQEKHSFSYSEEETELEHSYRTAILTQLAERISTLETNLEDFAVILTRHPATMNQYYTPAHLLYEAMKWATKQPEDKWGKEIWQEIHSEEKTYEGMVAERLIASGRFPPNAYDGLQTLPWVKMELSKYGNFDLIVKLYAKKWKEYFRQFNKKPKELR